MKELDETNALSSLQIETIVYACQVSYIFIVGHLLFHEVLYVQCISSKSTSLYGRGIFIIFQLELEQVSSSVMELVLVKDVPLLDWSGKIGSREGIRQCKTWKIIFISYSWWFSNNFSYGCLLHCLILAVGCNSRWVSVGSDLKYDARRDLDDVGAKCVQGVRPFHFELQLDLYCTFNSMWFWYNIYLECLD